MTTDPAPNPVRRIRRYGQIGGRIYAICSWIYYEALLLLLEREPMLTLSRHQLRYEIGLIIFHRWRPIPGAAHKRDHTMFGKIRDRITGAGKRLSGKTDLLEGIAAACVLVAAADGTIDDGEVDTMLKALCAHEQISAAFGQSQTEACVDKMLARAKQGRAGRLGLLREIEDVKAKSSTEDAEMLLMIAIDVADAAGGIEAKERAVLIDIGQRLGLSAERYING